MTPILTGWTSQSGDTRPSLPWTYTDTTPAFRSKKYRGQDTQTYYRFSTAIKWNGDKNGGDRLYKSTPLGCVPQVAPLSLSLSNGWGGRAGSIAHQGRADDSTQSRSGGVRLAYRSVTRPSSDPAAATHTQPGRPTDRQTDHIITHPASPWSRCARTSHTPAAVPSPPETRAHTSSEVRHRSTHGTLKRAYRLQLLPTCTDQLSTTVTITTI